MIHSARPIVSSVLNIAFAWNLFCFEKRRRTDGQHLRKQLSLPAVTTGRPRGSKLSLPAGQDLSSRIYLGHRRTQMIFKYAFFYFQNCNFLLWNLRSLKSNNQGFQQDRRTKFFCDPVNYDHSISSSMHFCPLASSYGSNCETGFFKYVRFFHFSAATT